MPSFDPQSLAQWTSGSWSEKPQVAISGFCFDARKIEPRQCFVALSSGARDGHDFAAQALEGGAVAALVEKAVDCKMPQLQVADSLIALGKIGAALRSQFKKPVVGITGSCGKTSTKEMLRLLLGADRCHATAGNWNNRIGVPMTLMGLDKSAQDFAVIEAGINQPKEMHFLGSMIRGDLTIITNIGPAHLELLGSLENIASEKSQLAREAAPDSSIILPAEVLRYPAFAECANRVVALVAKGAPEPKFEVRDTIDYEIDSSNDGQSQILRLSGQSYRIESASRGIAVNAALAITAALRLGIPAAEAKSRIERWQPGGDRGRIQTIGAQTFYVDCYNANPASMNDALEAFTTTAPQGVAKLYILGAMNELGEFAVAEHRQVGERLRLETQDRAIFVGPTELTAAYREGAIQGGAREDQLRVTENVEAIESIVAEFSGAIFLKGSRSYRLEQLVPNT